MTKRYVIGAFLKESRDQILAQAAKLRASGDPELIEIAPRYEAAARRFIPERAIATEELRSTARALRDARAVLGRQRPAQAWSLLTIAARAWCQRQRLEGVMREYGWLP